MMAALVIDHPETVAEVHAVFAAYEKALATNDLDRMAAMFSEGPELVRFGIGDRQRGAADLGRWRANQRMLPPGRTLRETRVTTYGTDFAVVTTLFTYPGRELGGRQSQTWVRNPAWRIVHAHVSEIPAPAT
jgi:ketosteroid isomerase-like protein